MTHIVLFRPFGVDALHLYSRQRQSGVLEPADDGTGQRPLHAVGLYQNKRSFPGIALTHTDEDNGVARRYPHLLINQFLIPPETRID